MLNEGAFLCVIEVSPHLWLFSEQVNGQEGGRCVPVWGRLALRELLGWAAGLIELSQESGVLCLYQNYSELCRLSTLCHLP